LLDGLNNPGLHNVTVARFTIKNALYEGVVLLNTSDATVRDNHIQHNDTIPHTFGSGPACKGQPAYETDESGDCGGGLHLIGAVSSVISGNTIVDNADGILISDETRESRDNLITRNIVTDNPEECGIVLASHPPMGSVPPLFAPHYGVDYNTIGENVVARNGVKVGGAGAGIFSDGQGPGRVSRNVIIHNELTQNGIPGVALHTHVGPAFGAPADNMSENQIIGNFISGNGPDGDDTATAGTTGININSGGAAPRFVEPSFRRILFGTRMSPSRSIPRRKSTSMSTICLAARSGSTMCAPLTGLHAPAPSTRMRIFGDVTRVRTRMDAPRPVAPMSAPPHG